jgi:hypothetical protein
MRLSSKIWTDISALQQTSADDFASNFDSLCKCLDLLFAHYQSEINAVLSDGQIRNVLFVHHIIALMDANSSQGRGELSTNTIYWITEQYLTQRRVPVNFDQVKLKDLSLQEDLDFNFDGVDGAAMGIGSKEVC